MVRITCLDVSRLTEDQCAGILATLSPERRNRAERYLAVQDRRLCIGAGYLLDCALRERGKREKDAVYIYGAHGKPYLADKEFYFNLSHSGALAVLATAEREVGIDVQEIRSVSPALEKKVCTLSERTYLAQCGARREEAFFRIWTAKESVMKYCGLGLALPFSEIETRVSARGLTAMCCCGEFPIAERSIDGARVSVCAEEDVGTVREID